MTRHTIAVDLGGTRVRVALVDDRGTVIRSEKAPTPSDEDTPAGLVAMVGAVIDGGATDGVGCDEVVIGIPGIIDHAAGRVVYAPNLNQDWLPLLSVEWFGGELDQPVSLANDADLAAVGEAFFGAGHQRDTVYVTISTGVGAGAVFGGRVMKGRFSGLELGHTIVDLPAAGDGRPATVEQRGAGPAIAKAAAEAGLIEREADLAELVRSGQPEAVALWDAALESVGCGIANLAWLLAPEVVVIGGGVGANNPDLILPRLDHWLMTYGPSTGGHIDVVTAELGDDAALAGAARWFEAVGERP
ncbi:MAG: ROK family protein [Actinomycetota bacterium]